MFGFWRFPEIALSTDVNGSNHSGNIVVLFQIDQKSYRFTETQRNDGLTKLQDLTFLETLRFWLFLFCGICYVFFCTSTACFQLKWRFRKLRRFRLRLASTTNLNPVIYRKWSKLRQSQPPAGISRHFLRYLEIS